MEPSLTTPTASVESIVDIQYLLTFFGSIIVLLLGIIGYFLKQTLKSIGDRFQRIEERQNKHSETNDDQAKEISELKSVTSGLVQLSKENSNNMRMLQSDLRNLSQNLIVAIQNKP